MKYSIIIIAISVTISIILGLFLLKPKYEELNDLQSQLRQKNIELENQNKYAQLLFSIERSLEEKRDLVTKINSALPADPDIPSLLNFLKESTADQTGMSLLDVSWQEISLSREGRKERFKEYSLRLQLSGSYVAFKNFLYVLERSSRLINVIHSEFSMPTEENEPIFFDVILKVYSY
ncbi:MAG: type 4a pilus biogenesis protein PilO [Patescibacteria group bacterium]|nr:type 4a pilus biogenesis protein PilO [Patescibacteria group bacterium]